LSRNVYFIFFALFALALSARGDDPLQKASEEFFPLALNGTVTVDHTDGPIRVYGWNEPRVRLVAVRNAYTRSRLEQIRVATKSELPTLAIRSVIPAISGLFADRSGTIDYTIVVPQSTRMKLKLANGEITLQGLRGANVDLELVNGRVFILDSYAQVRAQVRQGRMQAVFGWWENLPAAYDLFLEHGTIAVRLPQAARFGVAARTFDGRISQQFGLPAPAQTGAGQVLEAATAPDSPVLFHLRTGDGNISLEAIR
jgi:hypothetical protein